MGVRFGRSVVLAACLASACGGAAAPDRTAAPPSDVAVVAGLDTANEIPLAPVAPVRSDASFDWRLALKVDGLPAVNIGRPSATLLSRPEVATNLPRYVCTGIRGDAGCEPESDSRPSLSRVTVAGTDAVGWVWVGVPVEAMVVRFSAEDGSAMWQRPIGGAVVFPQDDAFGDDCGCRIDAFDDHGEAIVAIDVAARHYLEL